MIPDFPHNIRIRLAQLKFFYCTLTLLSLCPVGCLSLRFLNWDSQQSRDLAMSGRNKKTLIRPILFLYYEESLVSSNLKSNLLVLILKCTYHICLKLQLFYIKFTKFYIFSRMTKNQLTKTNFGHLVILETILFSMFEKFKR